MSGRGARVRLIVLDAVLVATGYVVGVSLRLADPFLSEMRLMFVVNLAVALPLIVMVHLGANGLAGMYRLPPRWTKVPIGTTVLSSIAAVLILLAVAVAISVRPIPLSAIVLGGLATLVLMVLVQVGRTLGRELSEQVFPVN